MDSSNLSKVVLSTDTDNELIRMQSSNRVQASILRAMHDDNDFCDVSLYGAPCPGTKTSSLRPIFAYKAVLAHASSRMKNIFTNGRIDFSKSECKIENVDHESLRRIVEFIHTDELVMGAANGFKQIRGILVGAKFLLITNIADACESFFAGQLHLNNCTQLWCFAREYHCLELLQACLTFITDHIEDLRTNSEFLRLPYADCAKLLMCEAFIAANPEVRYRAALSWLLYDSKGRAGYVRDVLNMVPFNSGLLPLDLVAEAGACSLLRENAPDLVHEAMLQALNQAKDMSLLVYLAGPVELPTGPGPGISTTKNAVTSGSQGRYNFQTLLQQLLSKGIVAWLEPADASNGRAERLLLVNGEMLMDCEQGTGKLVPVRPMPITSAEYKRKKKECLPQRAVSLTKETVSVADTSVTTSYALRSQKRQKIVDGNLPK